MKIHAFVQAHHADGRCFFSFGGKSYLEHVISRAQQVPEIQRSILLVPSCEENRTVFAGTAAQYGIDVFYGDVDNRLKRFLDCAEQYGTDIVVRLPSPKPLFRIDLVSQMIRVLVANADIDLVTVPSDFPHFFSCEVVRVAALRQLASAPLSKEETKVLFSDPVIAAEQLLPRERICVFRDLAKVSDAEIEQTRELRRSELAAGGSVLADSERKLEHMRYSFAAKYVREKDKVLDVACGAGNGCATLSQVAKRGAVTGIDLEENSEFAKIERLHSNVHFLVGDATDLKLNGTFDRIVSFETIEHLEQPEVFVRYLKSVLATDGLMILSVPKEMSATYLDRPLNPYHVMEYSATKLSELLARCDLIPTQKFMQNSVGEIEEGWPPHCAGSFIVVCGASAD